MRLKVFLFTTLLFSTLAAADDSIDKARRTLSLAKKEVLETHLPKLKRLIEYEAKSYRQLNTLLGEIQNNKSAVLLRLKEKQARFEAQNKKALRLYRDELTSLSLEVRAWENNQKAHRKSYAWKKAQLSELSLKLKNKKALLSAAISKMNQIKAEGDAKLAEEKRTVQGYIDIVNRHADTVKKNKKRANHSNYLRDKKRYRKKAKKAANKAKKWANKANNFVFSVSYYQSKIDAERNYAKSLKAQFDKESKLMRTLVSELESHKKELKTKAPDFSKKLKLIQKRYAHVSSSELKLSNSLSAVYASLGSELAKKEKTAHKTSSVLESEFGKDARELYRALYEWTKGPHPSLESELKSLTRNKELISLVSRGTQAAELLKKERN